MDRYLRRDQSAHGGDDVRDEVDDIHDEVGDFQEWSFQLRMDAWDAWAASVADISAASIRALEEAVADVHSDDQDLSIARGRVAAAPWQMNVVSVSWPGFISRASSIPWIYLMVSRIPPGPELKKIT